MVLISGWRRWWTSPRRDRRRCHARKHVHLDVVVGGRPQ
ncbi:hypothetical protein XCR_0415 [Xanthomonas campestris pv. raphani 756C]|nr:hypothetical protein XCR_0415 [Xanthomonas campestris pv. raphani 756C]